MDLGPYRSCSFEVSGRVFVSDDEVCDLGPLIHGEQSIFHPTNSPDKLLNFS